MNPLIKFFCLIIFVAFIEQAEAESIDVNVRSPQTSAVPPDARFEIVQSTLATKWTFRLDRFNGRVWILKAVDSNNPFDFTNDRVIWDEMEVKEGPKILASTRPRFQLFTSGLVTRHTFLIDEDTGKSWILVEGGDYETYLWRPFVNQ